MKKKEAYEKYKEHLKNHSIREVNKNVFYTYLEKHGGYEGTIDYLSKPKNVKNSKTGNFKAKNIKEILDYVKLFSVERASREYKISERTIYRYIDKQKK